MSKTTFITGANGGIGNALCQIFKENEWQIIGIDSRGANNDFCDLFFQDDISITSVIKKIHDTLDDSKTSLNCIINNAAIQIEKKLVDTTEEEWFSTIQNNIGSIFLTTKYLLDLFEGGSIINISSVHARATSKGLAAYVATKGAISALTRAMALELADHNIRVNAILPGAIDTDMLRSGLNRNDDPDMALMKLIEATPLKRIGTPEDIANLALFLADNEKSAFITGQDFICDGGVLAQLASE